MHFVAEELRRRGLPIRHLHVWDDYDRFRKVPAGVDAAWGEHIGRPLCAVPDPEGCHDSWAEHFKAAAASTPCTRWAWRWRRSRQTETLQAGRLPGRGAERRLASATRSRRCWRGTAPRRRAADADDAGRDRPPTTTSRSPATWPGSRTSRTAATAGATRSHSRPTTTTPPTSPTPAVQRLRRRTNLSPGVRGQAGLEGRLADALGLREASTSSPAAMDHATPGSSFTVGHELVEDDLRLARPAWFGYGFVGFAGMARRCRRRAAASRPPRTRCASWRRRSCAGSTCAGAQAGRSTSTSARGGAALRRVGRAGAQGGRPGQAGRAVLAFERAASTAAAGRCRPRRSSCRSGCCRRWPT